MNLALLLVLSIIFFITDTVPPQLKTSHKPKVIAHRGASGYAPEHTFAAFNKAIEQQADYIEADIQMTKDGELILIHDPTVTRTSNGHGTVMNMTLQEIRRLDAGSWFNPYLYHTETIPTLQQFLRKYAGKIGLLLELKDPVLYPGIESALADQLKKHHLHEQGDHSIIVQSFDAQSIKKFHSLLPAVPTGFLTSVTLDDTKLATLAKYCKYINPNQFIASSDLLTRIKAHDCNSFVWTINSVDAYNRVANLHVDGIITDYPDYFSSTSSLSYS
ncbi:glycerophosphodiester phosphodiesterase [Bacillus salinus]|uniref:glycerophosphodiester phosphodiesterase n=1 Tax=Bacillus sp. HMF5848 TaxID=2495421 RepID=UPI00163A8341|nr:glycerophosphodiester phosphodiesterase family protein [Bacillus sp. HMF5848]